MADFAADATDEMMMRAVVVSPGDLIDGRSANLGRADQPQPHEEIERAVDGGTVDGRAAAVDALIQLGHGDMPAHLAQRVEDDLALGVNLWPRWWMVAARLRFVCMMFVIANELQLQI